MILVRNLCDCLFFFLCNSFYAVTQVMSPMGGSLRDRRKKGRGRGRGRKTRNLM